jgi:hypothetical protein
LGLPDTADEAACLEAARTATQARTQFATFSASIAGAAGVAATSTAEQIVAAIKGGPSQVATLSARVQAAETELTNLRTATLQRDAETAIDAAIKDGVPILASRDYFIGAYVKDAAGTKAVLSTLPKLNTGGTAVLTPPDPANPIATLSAIDLETCKQMGTDPLKLVEYRKKQAEARGDGRAA